MENNLITKQQIQFNKYSKNSQAKKMTFYNFEKYNDVFCFEKLSHDYQPLLKIYESNYKTSLNTFLKEYEENTELRFIESQLYFCDKEINIQKSIITSLEKLDNETFYYLRNRIGNKYDVYKEILNFQDEDKTQTMETTPGNPKNDDTTELKAPIVIDFSNDDDDDDDDILDMHATAYNFIKFISNRITSLCLINEFLEQRKREIEITSTRPTVSAPEFEFKNIFDPENAKPKPEFEFENIFDPENAKPKPEFEFENNFDPENAKPKKVYDYFKKELVDAGYLSLEDLEKYLIMAFQDKTVPAEKFSFAKKIKVKDARDIFYRYYTVITNAGNGNKMKYAELLGNYFTGHTAEKVYNNF